MAKKANRQASIFVNGQQVETTAKNVAAAFRQASNELGRMVIGSDEYISKLEEVSGLDKKLKQHRENIRGVEQGWNLTKAGLSNFIGVAAGAFAVDSLIGYGQQLFGVASQMELMEKKAKTVFGDALPKMTEEAEKNARSMGLTNAQYIAAAANIQDLLVPMGFQRQQAAEISAQLTNLSGALSEWSGGQRSAKEVSEILSKSLLGERDALNSLGIDIKQAEIDAELLARGLNNLTGESKKQAEAAVTLDLILRKSADAQQQYAEGAGSMARRNAELSAKIAEITEKIATLLIPVFEGLLAIAGPIIDVIGDIAGGFEDMINPAEAASQAFDEQSAKVAGLEKDLLPLLNRYDQLMGQTNLTTDEQAELKKIIEQVSNVVPTAVTEFDKYGRALSLNTDAARAFITVEKERLKVQNETAIAENERKLKALKAEQRAIQNELNKGKKITTSGLVGGQFGGSGGVKEVALNKEEVERGRQRLKELEYLDERGNRVGRIVGIEAEIARLRGDNLDALTKPAPDPTTTGETDAERLAREAKDKTAQDAAAKTAEQRKKEQEREAEELQSHLERIQDIVKKHEEEADLAALRKDDQEVERIRLKYQKEIDLVQSKFQDETKVKEAVAALEAQREAEIAQVREDQREAQVEAEIEAYFEDQERIEAAKREYLEGKTKAEAELKEFSDEALFTEKQLEIQALEEHYATLLKLAEQYGIDTTSLKEAYAKKQADIEKKFADKTTADQVEAQKARLAALQSAFTAFGDVTTALFDFLDNQSEESAALQKVATLAKIAFDTAAAISSLVAASNANPANAVTFGAAGIAQYVSGIARILSNVAQAKKILSEAPKVQQKYTGSFLSVTGQTDGRQYRAQSISAPNTGLLPGRPVLFNSTATGQPVLASERGAEYFVASKDLQNPYVANLVRMIDNITHGAAIQSVPQFQDGGANPAGTLQAPVTTGPALDPATIQQFTQAINTLNAILASGITATIPDRTITDLDKRYKIINDASGGFFSNT